MYCSHCGEEVQQQRDKFCDACGKHLCKSTQSNDSVKRNCEPPKYMRATIQLPIVGCRQLVNP